MTSVFLFQKSYTDKVLALWRSVHPDLAWLDNRGHVEKVLALRDGAIERVGFVVTRNEKAIATVFGTCLRYENWPNNRIINFVTRVEDVSEEWVSQILTALIETDRERPGTWHIAKTSAILSPALAPLLEAGGFVRHSSTIQMAWSGESAVVVDSGTANLQRYAGGSQDVDAAIVDLYNRSFRPSRLVPPRDLKSLWRSWPGLEAQEFVLAWENERLVAYAEWSVTNGEAFIASYAVARSHWGTEVGRAVGTSAMKILIDRGHRKILSTLQSNNAASMRPHLDLGWKVRSEVGTTFVRKL
jgi:hypothetical protein